VGVEGTRALGGIVGTVVELCALWVTGALGGAGSSWTSGLLMQEPMGVFEGFTVAP